MSGFATGRSQAAQVVSSGAFAHDPAINLQSDFFGTPYYPSGGIQQLRPVPPGLGFAEGGFFAGDAWNAWTECTYLGNRVFANCSAAVSTEFRTDPVTGHAQLRQLVTLTLQLLRGGASASFQTQEITAWRDSGTQGPGAPVWYSGSGSWSAVDHVTLFEQLDPTPNGRGTNNLHEEYRFDGFTMDASVVTSWQWEWTETVDPPIPPHDPFTDPPQIRAHVTPFTLTVGGTLSTIAEETHTRHPLNDTHIERRWQNVGLTKDLPCDCHWNLSRLQSGAGGISATKGKMALTGGDVNGALTAAWAGNATTDFAYWDTTATPPQYTDGPNHFIAFSAYCEHYPSWSVALSADAYDYRDGTNVPTILQHRASVRYNQGDGTILTKSFVLGEFATHATAYTYPTSGECHRVRAYCDDGLTTDLTPHQSMSTAQPAPGLARVELFEGLWLPKRADLLAVGLPTKGGADLTLVGGEAFLLTGSMELVGKGAWADSAAHQLESVNGPVHSSAFDGLEEPLRFPLHVLAPWQEGQVQIVSPWQFTVFDLGAQWKVWATSSFLADNSGYHPTATLLTSGTGLIADVPAARVLLSTIASYTPTGGGGVTINAAYLLKPAGFRYYHLRAKASVAGATFRFGLGVLSDPVGNPIGPEYAWEFTVAAADTWQTFDLDLALPPLKCQVSVTSQVISGGTILHYGLSYVGNASLLHPQYWMPAPAATGRSLAGAVCWLDLGTAALYSFDYLEGYHQASGARTPIRWYLPLDGKGELVAGAEQQDDSSGNAYAARLVVNGTVGITLPLFGTLLQWWSAAGAGMGALYGDTGILPSSGVDVQMNADVAENGEFTESRAAARFGKFPASGATASVYGQLRNRTGFFGYYGQGDAKAGTYARQFVYYGDVVWNGSVLGNLGTVGNIGAGLALTFHNDPDGALVASATSDDDGFWEGLLPYGVVFPYSNRQFGLLPGAADTLPAPQWTGLPPVYTALGLTMNAWWVKGAGTADSEGYAASGGARVQLPIFDRWPFLEQFAGALVSRGVANLQFPDGRYMRADVSAAGRIVLRASNFTTPPFAAQGDVTAGGDSEPRLAWRPDNSVSLVWTRGTDVLIGRATDWGASFDGPVVLFTGARRPAIAIDPLTGILSAAAYRTGLLACALQHPGELTPTIFNVTAVGGGTIAVEDDSLDLAYGPDGRLWCAARLAGSGNVALMKSADRGRSYDLIASVLPGAKHPAIAFRPPGILIAAGWIGGGIQVVSMTPGQVAPTAPVPVKKVGGIPLVFADDSFHIAAAFEGRARVVLAALAGGDSLPSEWASGDLAATVDLVS